MDSREKEIIEKIRKGVEITGFSKGTVVRIERKGKTVVEKTF